MLYLELNLINQLYLVPPIDRRPVKFCPREEIADPLKLNKIINYINQWDYVTIMGESYFRGWIPWNKKWNFKNGVLNSSGVYVLTNHTNMFQSMKELLENPTPDNVRDWLELWYDTCFLVSGPMLHFRELDAYHSDSYFVNNRYPVQRVSFNLFATDYLSQMILSQSYTICNGLTLLLAMYRLSYISMESLAYATSVLPRDGDNIDTNFNVAEVWSVLYNFHPTPHIADNPWYYLLMSKQKISYDITNLFKPSLENIDNEEFFHMQVSQTMITAVYSTPNTVSIQHFDKEKWDNLLNTNWPLPPFALDDDPEDTDTFIADMSSLFLNAVRTKTSWKWWNNNKITLFNKLLEHFDFKIPYDTYYEIINACLNLYINSKEHFPRLPYNRIRKIWNDIIINLDPYFINTNTFLHKTIIKYFLVDKLSNYDGTPTFVITNIASMPYVFLKDVFDNYSDKINIYNEKRICIYSKYRNLIVNILQENSSNTKIELSDTDDNLLYYKSTLIYLFKSIIDTSIYGIFYKNYLEKRITNKLLSIKKGFGIVDGTEATICNKSSDIHIVGIVMLNYLYDNKNELIR